MINCGGSRLTPKWFRRLESFWNCPVAEAYGLSEALGAWAYRHGSEQRFTTFGTALYEVIELDSNRPIQSGVGRLVVTCLLPLNRTQPIIRYNTEDIVEIEQVEPTPTNQLVFDFLGRER